MTMARDWDWFEPRERDDYEQEYGFVCAWCVEVCDDHEAIVLTRHPEMPTVCINCARRGGE
ncbi:hypothetical protein ASF58_16350 [Methylobacterium sp. Leaf125]|nr:hypothetical protein ASF58_16350 [Methylobacterium sp. Leaf125]